MSTPNAAAVLAFTLLAGCASTQIGVKSGEIPSWINRLPQTEGKLYAVGISGPTYYPEDAKLNAAENARKELAKSLSVRVQALYLALQRGEGHQESEISLVTVSFWAIDIVVLHSQVLELWVDQDAKIANSEPGTVYALALIDLDTVRRTLKSHIESNKNTQ
jgi:hypothetical protein